MKQGSEYEREINRMTPFEKMLVAIVMVILFFIFCVVSYEVKSQDEASPQTYQTKGEEQ